MNLPPLVLLSDYDATRYLDAVFDIFNKEVANGSLSFLQLPIKCPWHPPFDDKHFCFWHLISEQGDSSKEEDRIPDPRRCERIRWIAYVINNANDENKVWCWEKDVKTKRGRSSHIILYLHEENYMVVLRRKSNRLELVTAYLKTNRTKMGTERLSYFDPRGS